MRWLKIKHYSVSSNNFHKYSHGTWFFNIKFQNSSLLFIVKMQCLLIFQFFFSFSLSFMSDIWVGISISDWIIHFRCSTWNDWCTSNGLPVKITFIAIQFFETFHTIIDNLWEKFFLYLSIKDYDFEPVTPVLIMRSHVWPWNSHFAYAWRTTYSKWRKKVRLTKKILNKVLILKLPTRKKSEK